MRLAAARSLVVSAAVAALALATLATVPAAAASPEPDVKITEFAYGGTIANTSGDGEYVEITNLGSVGVDMSSWTYGTSDAAPGAVSLAGFGTLAPGESAIVTDVTPAEFRTDWGLTDAVKVVNDNGTTLNSGPKTMYVFDADKQLADSVTYAKGFLSGKGVSAWVDAAHVGAKADTTGWAVSTTGDGEKSWKSASGSIGSPGISSLAALSAAAPDVAFTEFAYGGKIGSSSTGGDGEYAEVTNVGRTPVDMTGWSYDTDDAEAVAVSLAGFGTLAPGESAIITDVTPAEFRAEWGLKDAVRVVTDGDTTLNSGPRTMYLRNTGGTTVDAVAYDKGYFTGGKGQSAWVDPAHVGAQADTTGWTFSTAGDTQGSWASARGAVGSPGTSAFGIHDAAFVHTTPTDGDGDGSDDGDATPTDANWADIVINEVTSDNDSIGYAPLPTLSDGIELYNTGSHDVSLKGWKQIDSGDASAATDFSGGLYVNGVASTTIPAGGYGVFQSTKGLSSGGDAVKIYTPDGTLVDSVTFTAGQAGVDETVNTDGTYTSLARCPDGGSTFLEVPEASFGASNAAACAAGVPPLTSGAAPEAPCQTEDSGDAPGIVPVDATPWPGSATPTTIDAQCSWVTSESGQDLSGLAFDPSNAKVLYAVKNKSHVWRLVNRNGAWVKDTADGWADGKDIRFPNGGGAPDSEGLTVGPDGALYITTERDNNASNVPLDSILRFDPTTPATTISATDQWTLTDDLGYASTDAADSNLGFEGVAFVPDSFLTAQGFRADDGTLYNPANYPKKALGGLFFGAVEKTGHIRVYVLNSDHTFTRVADIDTGLAGVMDDSFDPDLGGLWAHCDNTCGNATALLGIGSTGHFTVDHTYARPAKLPNYNLEGFAVAPASPAVNGQRQVLWTDDGNRFGHSLWAGTLTVDQSTVPPAGPGAGNSHHVALTTGGRSTLKPGDWFTVTASGLVPGTRYAMTLHSTPVLLGSGTAGKDGTLSITAMVPENLPVGAHTITVAAASDPTAVLASLPLTVVAAPAASAVVTPATPASPGAVGASGALATTGTDALAWLPTGIVLLLLGASALAARRLLRRRDRPQAP